MKSQNSVLWFSIALVNAIALYVASLVVPAAVVLGNANLSNWMAVVITSALLTALLWLVKPVMKTAKLKVKSDLAINMTYLVTNVVGLWVLARLANYSGFGVSSYMMVVVLGLVLNTLQYGVWKMLDGKKK